MNRRTFAQTLGGGLLAPVFAGSLSTSLAQSGSTNGADATYQLSVMLWTILRDEPFEQRLEKVAEAGYRNVELVGEYAKWNEDDFARAIAKKTQLGIRFDCTAGLKHSLCNPAERDALVAEFRATLPIMERLECPAMIVLSGNTVGGITVETQQQSCVDGLKALAAVIDGKK